MYLKSICSLVFLFGAVAYPQAINLRGKVLKSGDLPLPSAVVTIVGLGWKDTTDAQGAYAFSGTAGAIKPGDLLPRSQGVFLDGNGLDFIVTHPTTLKVEAFEVNGGRLGHGLRQAVSPGRYRLDIAELVRGTQLTFLRATLGNQVHWFRHLPAFQGRRPAFSPEGEPAVSAKGLLKKSAGVDTLKFEAGGYASKKVSLDSYDAAVNVTLEKAGADLDKFSFFITSQEGLFKLAKAFSGGDKGFGGDLRYGNTGAGAGLKGADKICEDLAESSMPGSKVKVWRAFLSATADASGKQVNAIDRVGEGPWYDRLGRLVAENKAGLLSTRPAGDPEISADLPNEFGVPNHRPDPTKPEVDNHLTMTGSNNQGQLYGPNSTCEDWTSTAKRPGPRVGMSWPQAGGMPLKNWISEWDQSGCEAGFDLDPRTGAGNRDDYSVGKGGGYGGYYCFALSP